ILVLGEALVDEFHDGPVAGGAPFNVARSLAALGVPMRFVSRIGAHDAAGRLVLDSAACFGLAVDGIQRDPQRPTGRVSVY
ncbi:PfkB family carbohydrate kinase, partial [Acinetobacter baumannii]